MAPDARLAGVGRRAARRGPRRRRPGGCGLSAPRHPAAAARRAGSSRCTRACSGSPAPPTPHLAALRAAALAVGPERRGLAPRGRRGSGASYPTRTTSSRSACPGRAGHGLQASWCTAHGTSCRSAHHHPHGHPGDQPAAHARRPRRRAAVAGPSRTRSTEGSSLGSSPWPPSSGCSTTWLDRAPRVRRAADGAGRAGARHGPTRRPARAPHGAAAPVVRPPARRVPVLGCPRHAARVDFAYPERAPRHRGRRLRGPRHTAGHGGGPRAPEPPRGGAAGRSCGSPGTQVVRQPGDGRQGRSAQLWARR